MASGQQIAFQPSLAHMLAEDLHHPAGLREIFVHWQRPGHPGFADAGNRVAEAVRGRLVRPEDAEVLLLLIGFHDGVKQLPQNPRGFDVLLSAALDFDRKITEVGHFQGFQQQAAVGVGVHAHAPAALGRNPGQFGAQRALFVEEFLGLVAPHPLFEQAQVIGLLAQLGEGDLV